MIFYPNPAEHPNFRDPLRIEKFCLVNLYMYTIQIVIQSNTTKYLYSIFQYIIVLSHLFTRENIPLHLSSFYLVNIIAYLLGNTW